MLSTSNFIYIFVGSCFISVLIVHFLNKKASPLRKAWNVYSAMYVLHFVLFMGLFLTLPAVSPSYGPRSERFDDVQPSSEELQQEIRHQGEDIEELKNHVYATTQTLQWALFTLALFAPMVYYNLIKYNLRIEELSGKRMGSFD